MTNGISRRDPDFEGPDPEHDERIETRLRALQHDFDDNGPFEWNANWPEWAWMNPHDEEFREELEREYAFFN